MGNTFLTLHEFNDRLKQWSGKQIKVVKHELNDIDQTMINLENISYQKEDQTIDDYVSRHALHLNGTGLVETTENNYNELPSNLFEIPLEENALYEYDGEKFILSTSRGVYTLELLEG